MATDSTTPLELLGVSEGLTVIDPTTILTRLWYFDGKFLRAEGFRLDQAYVRSLAALSHQATGSGVVHGFDVTRPAGGDSLRVSGGLALGGSGRVAYLPRQVDLPIAELIRRSADPAGPAQPDPPGVADFRRCAPATGGGPDVTVAARPLYLLTVAGIEALCGEEERFGQLCVDACATETDRSTVVEGVSFRLRELTLTLPTSAAVPFDARHLRSQLASAYFAAERAAVPARISGAGLATPVWCAGAEAVGGDEVPLAVLDRVGGVTTLLDVWTARRELQESGPRRYWARRMAMRPWDVFLAQVLQFQCQLVDLAAGPAQDPNRAALAAAARLLDEISDPHGAVEAVRARIAAALDAPAAPAAGSLLLDEGVVELPPAGYLPIVLSRPVEDQVRAIFGPGVDLRFCVTRPDAVAELLQQAQHLDRISLTRGIDEPDRREEVDVIVPGGTIGAAARAATAYTGRIAILPTDGQSAADLSVVARDRSGPGWAWCAAAYGAVPPQQVSVRTLAEASVEALWRAFTGAPADGDPLDRVNRTPDAEHERLRRSAAFTQRLVAEGHAAAARRAAMRAATRRLPPDRPLADGADRPVTAWAEFRISEPLDTVPLRVGAGAQGRFTFYSRASTRPVFTDVQLTGVLRVADRVRTADRVVISTMFSGFAEIIQGDASEPRREPIDPLPIVWTLTPSSRTLVIELGQPVAVRVTVRQTPAPRHVSGVLAIPDRRAGERIYATLELDERDGVLAPGAPGRTLTESVIAVLGAELAAPGRDPGFPQYAAERMFGGLAPGGPARITATTDWVFFTRRRDRICAGESVEQPARLRTYRLFHGVQADLGPSGDPLRAAAPGGFEPVATVQFAADQATLATPVADLRAAWLAKDRGELIVAAVVGDFAESDGEGIAIARLSTVRSALADLADSTGVQARYAPEVPAEYHDPGLDGAMFTVGKRRVSLACVTLFRMFAKDFDAVTARLAEVRDSEPMSAVLRDAGARAETSTAQLSGDSVVDAEQHRTDWSGLRILGAVTGLPSGIDKAETLRRRRRVTRVSEVIGISDLDLKTLTADTGDCDAILLVAVEPRID